MLSVRFKWKGFGHFKPKSPCETKQRNSQCFCIFRRKNHDGENHDQDALDQAKIAAEQGVLIFTIGVGTSAGSPIPTFENGQSQYKKDKQGNTVVSKLNENMLSSLAAAGSGKYYNITNGEKVIDALQKYIETLEKQEFEQRTFSEYESYFQWFLALALLFLLIEFLLSYQKSEWWSKRDIFRV